MFKKGLIAGVAILIVGMLINFLLEAFIPGLTKEYQTAMFRPWTDPLMTAYFAYPFILGVVAAYLWDLIEKKFIGDAVNKAFQFAKLYFIIATIPGMFISYTTFQISLTMILAWTATGFVDVFVAGLVFTKIK